MTPTLFAALYFAEQAGAEINDVVRIDAQGECTNVGITWPGDTGITRYIQGFNEDESEIAAEIMRESVEVAEVSYVWIAMDDEAYQQTQIYGVARTMDGAKALCQAQEQKRADDWTRTMHDRMNVTEIRWDTAGESGVTGYGSMHHACERYEVSET